jgi:hypothetical protein
MYIAFRVSFMFRQLNSLLLRQTQEFMGSLIRLMEFTLRQVDFSEILKRLDGLTFKCLIDSIKLGRYVIVHRAGLKVYGQDE